MNLRAAFISGVKKGWFSFLWICKIVVPFSFLVMLLQWSGWLHHAEVVLQPLIGWLGLPSEAALPIISGMAINVYAAIATMTVIPFSTAQMTLIAVFVLIAHNLFMEGIIQHRSGMNGIKITVVRIAAAVVTVVIVSFFFGDTSQSDSGVTSITTGGPFLPALQQWALDTGLLLAKIFGIIIAVMIALEGMMVLGWTDKLYAVSRPLMRFLGLSGRTSILWVTAVFFGLMYGAAVIQDKAKREDLTKAELEHLHISVGINHSMLEDPVLFMALGINGFWLWVPKLVMAAIAVYIFRVAEYAVRRYRLKRCAQR